MYFNITIAVLLGLLYIRRLFKTATTDYLQKKLELDDSLDDAERVGVDKNQALSVVSKIIGLLCIIEAYVYVYSGIMMKGNLLVQSVAAFLVVLTVKRFMNLEEYRKTGVLKVPSRKLKALNMLVCLVGLGYAVYFLLFLLSHHNIIN